MLATIAPICRTPAKSNVDGDGVGDAVDRVHTGLYTAPSYRSSIAGQVFASVAADFIRRRLDSPRWRLPLRFAHTGTAVRSLSVYLARGAPFRPGPALQTRADGRGGNVGGLRRGRKRDLALLDSSVASWFTRPWQWTFGAEYGVTLSPQAMHRIRRPSTGMGETISS